MANLERPKTSEHRPPFEIRLFGGPTLFREGGVASISPLERHLLGFVAAHGPEGVERELVAATLWGTGERGQRRQRLSQALHSMDVKLDGECPIVPEGTLLRVPGDHARMDLDRFEAALAPGGRLEEAVELIRKGFFGGLQERMSRELTEWATLRHLDLRERVRARLAEVAQDADDQILLDAMVQVARLQLRLDPHREEPLRRLLTGLGLKGRSVEARAAFVSHEERARAEDPEWEPEPATERILERLEGMGVGGEVVDLLPMADRERLTASIRDALARAGSEPGTFRLVSVLSPIAEVPPFAILRGLLPHAIGGHPVFHLTWPEEADGAPLTPSEASLVRAIGCDLSRPPEYLANGGSGPTPLVVIDALRRSSEPPPPAIAALLESLRTSAVLIVIARASSVEGTDPAGLGRVFGREVTEATTVILHPYEQLPLVRALRARFPSGVPTCVLETAARLSRGSSALACELTSAWASAPAKVRHDQSESDRFLVALALRELPPLERDVVTLVTLLDRPQPDAAIARCLGVPEEQVVNSVRSLLSSGWLRVSETGPTLPDKELVRLLNAGFVEPVRSSFHSRIVDELEFHDPLIRSIHLVGAGRFEDAVVPLIEASSLAGKNDDGQRFCALAESTLRELSDPAPHLRLLSAFAAYLLRTGAPAAALPALERACALSRLTSSSPEEGLANEVSYLAALSQTATPDRPQLSVRARRLREELIAHRLWGHLGTLARIELRSVDTGNVTPSMEDTYGWLDRLVDELAGAGEAVPPEIALVLGSRLRFSCDENAGKVIRSMISSRDVGGLPPDVLAEAHQAHVLGLYHEGVLNLEEGVRARQALMFAANASRDPSRIARQHLNNAVWHLDTLDVDAAEAALARSAPLIDEHGSQPLRLEFLFNNAELELHRSAVGSAEALFEEGLRVVREGSADVGKALFASGVATCRLARGDLSGALQMAPPSDLLWGEWTVDLTILLRLHALLQRDHDGGGEFPERVWEIAARLLSQSTTWHLKVLTAMRGMGIPPDPATLASAVSRARELNLHDVSRALTSRPTSYRCLTR